MSMLSRSVVRSLHVRAANPNGPAFGKIRDRFLRLLKEQLHKAAADIRAFGTGSAEMWFQFVEQYEALVAAMRPAVGLVMLDGALAELDLIKATAKRARVPDTKTTAQEIADRLGIEVPPNVPIHEYPDWLLRALRDELDATFRQEYWRSINRQTATDIMGVIDGGLTNGWSTVRIARAVEAMQGGYSRVRAVRVARTETTRALNAGHLAGIQGLATETGLAIGKEWVSVLGSTTRPSHAAADGQQATAGGMFTVGGHECPYPGHYSLPAGECINCQCTLISSLAAEGLDD